MERHFNKRSSEHQILHHDREYVFQTPSYLLALDAFRTARARQIASAEEVLSTVLSRHRCFPVKYEPDGASFSRIHLNVEDKTISYADFHAKWFDPFRL